MSERPQLGKILLEAQIIKKEDIDKALAEQKRTGSKFGEALINLGIINSEDVHWGLANQLDLPFIRVQPEMVDPQAVALVPETLARKHNFIPFFLVGNELTIVTEDPNKTRAVNEVASATGCQVKVAIGLESEIRKAIDEVYHSFRHPTLTGHAIDSVLFTGSEIMEMGADSSGEALLNGILSKAAYKKATAVHLEQRESTAVLRLRIEGEIKVYGRIPTGWFQVLCARLREASDLPTENGVHSEGFLTRVVEDRRLAYYISYVRVHHGQAITLVDISCPDFPDDLTKLNIPAEDLARCMKLIDGRSGTVLVVGAEKMEKLKLIYLLLRHQHADMKKTFALGQMPWFDDDNFVQIKTRTDDPDELRQALKVVVGQDPDIIYIEDCWDRKILTLALQTSLSRCFIFANLNLRTTLSCLEYLIESVESKTLLCTAFRGAIALSAVRRLCPSCKKAEDRIAYASQKLSISRTAVEAAGLMRAGDGCPACRQSGYLGQMPIIEVLMQDEALHNLIKNESDFAKIQEAVLSMGHRTLEDRLKALILSGEVALDEMRIVEHN